MSESGLCSFVSSVYVLSSRRNDTAVTVFHHKLVTALHPILALEKLPFHPTLSLRKRRHDDPDDSAYGTSREVC